MCPFSATPASFTSRGNHHSFFVLISPLICFIVVNAYISNSKEWIISITYFFKSFNDRIILYVALIFFSQHCVLGMRWAQFIAVVNLLSQLKITILFEYRAIINPFYYWLAFEMLIFIFFHKHCCLVSYLLLQLQNFPWYLFLGVELCSTDWQSLLECSRQFSFPEKWMNILIAPHFANT